MALDITVTREADECIVCVNGEVDVSNAAELRSALEAALTGGTSKITADFPMFHILIQRVLVFLWG